MRSDNKNLILAIALSIAVLVGWNHFFGASLTPGPRPNPPVAGQPAMLRSHLARAVLEPPGRVCQDGLETLVAVLLQQLGRRIRHAVLHHRSSR